MKPVRCLAQLASRSKASRVLFIISVVGIDPVIAAAVQTQKDYTWRDVRFGERFVEIYNEVDEGRLTVDYGRLHDTEPVEAATNRNGYNDSFGGGN
jgi:hypothetical protein